MIKADNNPKGANTMSEITYSRQGDYLIPDLTLPTEPELPLWQVRFDAQGLSGEAQASDLSQSADIGQAERASARGRADSTPEVGASDEAALSRAGVTEELKEKAPMQWVGLMKQHPQPSGGSDTEPNLNLQVSDCQRG